MGAFLQGGTDTLAEAGGRGQGRGWAATPVDADPGNGAFRPFPDFPAIGPGTNSRVLVPSNPGESHWQKDLPTDGLVAIMPAGGGWSIARAEAHRAANQQLTPSTYTAT